MKIPARKKAQYQVTVPSTKKKIAVTSFDVASEFILVQAAESGDINRYIEAIQQVVSDCIVDPDVDVTTMPSVDVEYLFLYIRSKSVGEEIELIYTFNDGEQVPVNIDINKVKIDFSATKNNKLKLDDETMIVMRYPSMEVYRVYDEDESENEKILRYCANCVSQIVVGEDVYGSKDIELDDILEWLKSLAVIEFEKVADFVAKLPVLTYTAKITHPSTGEVTEYELRGLKDFF